MTHSRSHGYKVGKLDSNPRASLMKVRSHSAPPGCPPVGGLACLPEEGCKAVWGGLGIPE